MERSDLINTAIALLITAVGIILGQYYIGAYFLIIIAMVIFLIVLGKHVFSVIPKIYFTKDDASKAVLRIYESAAENGGQLIATLIKPEKLYPKEDYAINKLKSVKKTLIYKRFIAVDDKKMEDEWIRTTLSELDPKIELSVYFIKSLQPIISVFGETFPRANILLYSDGKKYTCLLGLDRLRTTDVRYELVNFTVEFHKPEVFHTLYRYFESMTVSHHRVKSLEEYTKSITPKEVHEMQIQSMLNSLVRWGAQSPDILHIGIFGKMATYLNGFQKVEDSKEHEVDLDVMTIINRGQKEEIKNKLLKLFESPNIEIIWGDDIDYFYHFRDENKITLDIEIHEKETDFYEQHPLLGCSIFAYYTTIYKRNGQYIENMFRLPYSFSTNERFKILRDDRKGLNEFNDRLQKNSVEIDPRRVVSLCVKNIVWAMTGSRPFNTNVAFKFLSNRWIEVFPLVAIVDIKNMLQKSQSDIRKKYKEYQALALKVVSDALQFSNSQLK